MKAKLLSIVLLIALFLGMAAVQPSYAQYTAPTVGLNQTGVSITPGTDAKSGQPGAVVSYTLTITNNSGSPVTLTISSTSISDPKNPWNVEVSPSGVIDLGDAATRTVAITIGIPGTVTPGSMDVTTVRISDTGGEVGNAVLTTTAAAAATSPAPGRPLLVLDSYSVGADSIKAGSQFDLTLRVRNNGQDFGRNVVLTFSGSEFMPVDTGGVRSLSEIDPGERLDVVQPFIASSSLFGVKYGSITVNVSYTDLAGAATYTETFTITISLSQPSSSGGVARPTATPTAVSRPQLVVSNYGTDVEPLQPGSMFTLDLSVTNLGNADARTVTMVLGGGGSADTGTPGAGGVSGGGGDLSTFAPLGSSNLVYLGDLVAGATQKISVPLVVNVTANPAAYAFKISFVFDDTKGVRQSNDQIITLLVFQLPQVEIGFYRDPGVFMTGNMNMLPLQITNLGRKSAVLGNIKVTAQNADVTNNVSLVGALEPGGYFTLDANVMPYQAGPLDLEVTVNYTDDFNQQRVIIQNMSIEVQEMPAPEPMPEGQDPNFPTDGNGSIGNENLWQKIVRFFKGLFGLDSSPSVPETPIEEIPIEPLPGNTKPIQPGPKG
ncbi:MAG: COG1361 S-layer family protein [Bellilinea sp.]